MQFYQTKVQQLTKHVGSTASPKVPMAEENQGCKNHVVVRFNKFHKAQKIEPKGETHGESGSEISVNEN